MSIVWLVFAYRHKHSPTEKRLPQMLKEIKQSYVGVRLPIAAYPQRHLQQRHTQVGAESGEHGGYGHIFL